jgi:hypothetical protein
MVAASMIAVPTLAVAVEPPDRPPGGSAESPSLGVTRSGAMSSDSAPTRDMTVSRPVPGSAPLVVTSAVSSASRVISTVAGKRSAGNIAVAVPRPTSQSPSVCPRGERCAQPNRAAPIWKHSSRCLLDHCRSLPGGAAELFRMRSSIGSMPSSTASSSIALSNAKDPGASPGARMNVVGGMCSGTIFWLIARFWVAYHSREVPCEVGSTNDRSAGVLQTESCRSAISVPVRSAPRVTVWTVAARPAVAVKTCSRVSAALTGRSRILADDAARNAGTEVRPLPPNAPPTKGFTACTDSGSGTRAAVSSDACRSEPWLPL